MAEAVRWRDGVEGAGQGLRGGESEILAGVVV